MTKGFVAKNCIEAISPYAAGKPIEETARDYGLDVDKIVKLASNENPLGMPESALKAALAAAASGNRYPDGNARIFRQAVARHHNLTEGRKACARAGLELRVLPVLVFGL